MSKAYDRIEWGFLRAVLGKLGFHDTWISWIMECVASVSYRFLINGSPKGLVTHWRVAVHIVGVISVIVGVLVRVFAANDPHFVKDGVNVSNQRGSRKPLCSEVKDLVREAGTVIKIRIIVAQGVTGSFPWSALSFAPMWLELIAFSYGATAFLMGLFVVASSLGGLFGGKMGYFLSTRLPNSGRIILAQISSASAYPACCNSLVSVTR